MLFDAANDAGGGDGTDDTTIMPDAEPDDLRSEITKLRGEAAKYRTRSKDLDETKQKLAKLEGLEEKFNKFQNFWGDEEEVDPEKLKRERESLQSDLQAERTKNVVTIQAISAGLDPDLTIAYLQNKGKLDGLDPSKGDKVSEILEKAATDKPALKMNDPVKVGGGGNGNDGNNGKPLNPIQEYQAARGILNNSK